MRIKTTNLIPLFLLLLFPTAIIAAPSSVPLSPTKLNPSQRKITKKILAELVLTEQAQQTGDIELYGDRLALLHENVQPLFPKLPDCDLRTSLSLAINAHQDLYTFTDETKRYPYYDLIANKQSPKIIAKYRFPVDLHSGQPYGRLEQGKIIEVEGWLSQIATDFRQRAQLEIH